MRHAGQHGQLGLPGGSHTWSIGGARRACKVAGLGGPDSIDEWGLGGAGRAAPWRAQRRGPAGAGSGQRASSYILRAQGRVVAPPG